MPSCAVSCRRARCHAVVRGVVGVCVASSASCRRRARCRAVVRGVVPSCVASAWHHAVRRVVCVASCVAWHRASCVARCWCSQRRASTWCRRTIKRHGTRQIIAPKSFWGGQIDYRVNYLPLVIVFRGGKCNIARCKVILARCKHELF